MLNPSKRADMLMQLTEDLVNGATLANLRAYVRELTYQGLADLSDEELVDQIKAHGYDPEDFS